MGEITSCRMFLKEETEENKRFWYLAGPAIFTSIVFAGHLTMLELDAVSTENMVIAGLALGIMLGMGRALETLCGQAYGAKQLHMMGVYMQRSWLILMVMCLCLMPIYLFATPILRLFGQAEGIAVLAGRFSLYMIPQLFAYGANFPIQKFLQGQSKVMTMAVVSGWLLIVHLGLGLPGAAVSLNISWWVVVLGQLFYILMGNCPGAWTGFSWAAFRDLAAFARLSIASEFWYYMFLIVLAGRLRNPEVAVAVAAISIRNVCTCTVNLCGWDIMVFFGFNAAVSRAAEGSQVLLLVVLTSSAIIGVFFMALVLSLRDVCGVPFTNSSVVSRAVSKLAVLFSFSLLLNSVQPILTGLGSGFPDKEVGRIGGKSTKHSCLPSYSFYLLFSIVEEFRLG
ncbi:unnamed protein product [Spirodela intermedia]|uniref:Uncharacterized protein n=1 Tax=Spirodela intermedia TaxID=51605 RepID=A0A7I8JTL5_SPIIN|nr:unnamed protein product [Spirodela intermedia]CAA6673520.1 unnamed protein product [Spirodela intermedia]